MDEVSDFPLYFYIIAGCIDGRNQAVSSFSFILKADVLPIVQIPEQQFNLLGGQRFNGQIGNCLRQRFATILQILDFHVGVGEQGGVSPVSAY